MYHIMTGQMYVIGYDNYLIINDYNKICNVDNT